MFNLMSNFSGSHHNRHTLLFFAIIMNLENGVGGLTNA